MADEITKFLAKLTRQEKELVLSLVEDIATGTLSQGDIKKLRGSKDIFRIRKGKFRIIYKKTKTDCTIISIDLRSEKTYRDF